MAIPEPERHFLYAIEFTDRVVKVGRTCDLKARFRAHRNDGREIGVVMTDCWISHPIDGRLIRGVETLLISECKFRWPVAQGFEWFDAPFKELIKVAAWVDEVAHHPPREERAAAAAEQAEQQSAA